MMVKLGHCSRNEYHILIHKHEAKKEKSRGGREERQSGNGTNLLKPQNLPLVTPPLRRLLLLTLPKMFHHLDTKYINLCGTFSFKPLQVSFSTTSTLFVEEGSRSHTEPQAC